jgi:hypothetical protein
MLDIQQAASSSTGLHQLHLHQLHLMSAYNVYLL